MISDLTYSIYALFLSDLKELVPCLQLAAETGHAPGMEAADVSPHHIPILTQTVLYSSEHNNMYVICQNCHFKLKHTKKRKYIQRKLVKEEKNRLP